MSGAALGMRRPPLLLKFPQSSTSPHSEVMAVTAVMIRLNLWRVKIRFAFYIQEEIFFPEITLPVCVTYHRKPGIVTSQYGAYGEEEQP